MLKRKQLADPPAPPARKRSNSSSITTTSATRALIRSAGATRVRKLVITGGPCAGKSTGMARLKAYFEKAGHQVFVVPEAATILLGGGFDWGRHYRLALEFQTRLIALQVQLEETFESFARGLGGKAVLLCDRGLMDGSAYVDDATWRKVRGSVGPDMTDADLREKRYEGVIHLVTAATGAETFYTTSNNAVRRESPAQARGQDRKTRAAWMGHPLHTVVDNRPGEGFEGKLERVVAAACRAIGLHAPAPAGAAMPSSSLSSSSSSSSSAPLARERAFALNCDAATLKAALVRGSAEPGVRLKAFHTTYTRLSGGAAILERRAALTLAQFAKDDRSDDAMLAIHDLLPEDEGACSAAPRRRLISTLEYENLRKASPHTEVEEMTALVRIGKDDDDKDEALVDITWCSGGGDETLPACYMTCEGDAPPPSGVLKVVLGTIAVGSELKTGGGLPPGRSMEFLAVRM